MKKFWIDIYEENDASNFSRRWLDCILTNNKDKIFYTEKKVYFGQMK